VGQLKLLLEESHELSVLDLVIVERGAMLSLRHANDGAGNRRPEMIRNRLAEHIHACGIHNEEP
jgi:hypothetical protein